jgi:hypothetical protein
MDTNLPEAFVPKGTGPHRKAKSSWLRAPRAITVVLTALLLLNTQALCGQTPIHITFESDELGTFPSQWTARNGNHAKNIYSVRAEGEKRFLHADAKSVSVQIGCERKWSLKEFPLLTWQWRAILFPVNTNEREKRGNDSVLGLYAVFGHMPFIKAIKYIWSDTLPEGITFDSPSSSSAKIVVLRSGRALMGKWVAETRDVLADYRRFFGNGSKDPVADGLAILTDSDDSKSHAIGDYMAIEALAKQSQDQSDP